MLQEIVTYMIIGSAITMAVIRIKNRFKAKKKNPAKVDFRKESFSMQHNCSDCSAECMLRNSSTSLIKENKDLCKKVEI